MDRPRRRIKVIETVSETYRKVKSQPKQLQQRVLHLSQLRSTLSTLEQQYSTGLTNIEGHLRAVFVRINDLKTLFLKLAAGQHQKFARRYWKTLIGDLEWNQIQNIFHLLEGNKTALALSILGSQTELSTQIYSELVERPSLSQVQIESSLNSNLIEADTAAEAPDSSIQKPDHQSSKSASQRGHLEKGREHSENTLRIAELPSPARSMEKTESQMQNSGYSSPINHFGETWKPSAAAEDTITGDKPLGMAPTLAGHAEKASTQSSNNHSGSKYGIASVMKDRLIKPATLVFRLSMDSQSRMFTQKTILMGPSKQLTRAVTP
ncbi:hypothetical protein MMC20_003544 [Loxospora ochrophaea]|nr:hypothetical protein [Loxospora ochrophaea]